MSKSLIVLFSLLSLTSCAYNFETQSTSAPTITVPYAEKDTQGDLTNRVIYLLNASGKFRPRTCGGRYLLELRLLDTRDTNVGYRYDQNEEGQLLTTTIPNETRLSALVEVTLIDNYSGCVVLGPAKISTSVDFDHDWDASFDAVNVFSLGQVSDYFDGKDTANFPLNRKLAQKIVDYLTQ